MKKFALLLFIVPVLVFSGCFDLIQYSEIKDGKYVSQLRISISKEMGQNGASMSASNQYLPEDPKFKQLGITVKSSTAENEFEQQMIVDISAPESALTKRLDTDKPVGMIPYKDKAGQYLYIFKNDKKSGNAESDKMAAMMMGSVKYRMMFGGKQKPQQCVLLSDEKRDGVVIPFVKMGDVLYIDFPLMKIMSGDAIILFSFKPKSDLTEAKSILEANIKSRPPVSTNENQDDPGMNSDNADADDQPASESDAGDEDYSEDTE